MLVHTVVLTPLEGYAVRRSPLVVWRGPVGAGWLHRCDFLDENKFVQRAESNLCRPRLAGTLRIEARLQAIGRLRRGFSSMGGASLVRLARPQRKF